MKIPSTILLTGDWTLAPLPPGDRPPGVCPPEEVGAAVPAEAPGTAECYPAERPSGSGCIYRRRLSLLACVPGMTLRIRFAAIRGRAELFLNGRSVGQCPGAGLPAEFSLTDAWIPGEENRLAVVLRPPRVPGAGGLFRLGLTGPVELAVAGEGWYRDAAVHVNLAMDRREAALSIVSQLAARGRTPAISIVEIIQDGLPVAAVEDAATLFPGDTVLVQSLTLPRPRLWWPNGLGEQPLYEARLALVARDGRVLDRRTVRFGIRDIRLEEPPDGETARLQVNGRGVLLLGWDWGLLDPLPKIDADPRCERLPALAAEAGANLLRVDAAIGLETEALYSACDRLGILVWQPFPPAPDLDTADGCTSEEVRQWAESVTAARRHHPSLAVWGVPSGLSPALETEIRDEDPQRIWLPDRHASEGDYLAPGEGIPLEYRVYGPLRLLERDPFADGMMDDLLARGFGRAVEGGQETRARNWLRALTLQQAVERIRRGTPGAAGWMLGPLHSRPWALLQECAGGGDACHAVRRAARPIHISTDADVWDRSGEPVVRGDAWIHADQESIPLLNAVVTVVDLGGTIRYQESLAAEAEGGRAVLAGDFYWRLPDGSRDFYLVRLELVNEEGRTLAENWAPVSRAPEPWFAPLLELSETELRVEAVSGGVRVQNRGPVVAFDVCLAGEGVLPADSGLVLLPGASTDVAVTGRGELRVDAWNAPARILHWPPVG